VAALRYSSGAEADLENIVDYSLRTWGAARTMVMWLELRIVAIGLQGIRCLAEPVTKFDRGCGGWRGGTSFSTAGRRTEFA